MSLRDTRPASTAARAEPEDERDLEDTARVSSSAAMVLAPSTAMQPSVPRASALAGRRAPKAPPAGQGQWTSVERAAAFLGVQVVTLRRTLEREARRRPDGSVIAQVDGITARKLGRVWRVWLDAAWRNPSAAE